MNDTTWHASPALVERYAAGDVSDATAYSIEAHLMACEECRLLVATRTDQDRANVVWNLILDEVDAPRVGPVEWLLHRAGGADHTARLLAATPSLRLSWLLAVVVTLLFAVTAAWAGPGNGALFLLVAPVLPVAGVAAAYGRGFDQAAEISAAAPTSGLRLVVLRTVAVVGTTIVLSLAASLAIPDQGVVTVAWLLPALGLTLATLAAGTVVDTTYAAVALSAAWTAGVGLSTWSAMGAGATLSSAARDAFAYQPVGQLAFLALALVAAAVLVARRDTFELETAR